MISIIVPDFTYRDFIPLRYLLLWALMTGTLIGCYSMLDSVLNGNIIQPLLNYRAEIKMNKLVFSDEELADFTRWLKVICEPNRLMLLEKIIEGVQCNCELGDSLQMAPNLISHHLSVLREVGLIEAERDPVDARWVYYSVKPEALEKLKILFGNFFDSSRIQPRRLTCGPQAAEEQRLGIYPKNR
jgi:ArsR family transcriptional regulator